MMIQIKMDRKTQQAIGRIKFEILNFFIINGKKFGVLSDETSRKLALKNIKNLLGAKAYEIFLKKMGGINEKK